MALIKGVSSVDHHGQVLTHTHEPDEWRTHRQKHDVVVGALDDGIGSRVLDGIVVVLTQDAIIEPCDGTSAFEKTEVLQDDVSKMLNADGEEEAVVKRDDRGSRRPGNTLAERVI